MSIEVFFFKFQIAHICNRIFIIHSMLCHSVANFFERKVNIVIDVLFQNIYQLFLVCMSSLRSVMKEFHLFSNIA